MYIWQPLKRAVMYIWQPLKRAVMYIWQRLKRAVMYIWQRLKITGDALPENYCYISLIVFYIIKLC